MVKGHGKSAVAGGFHLILSFYEVMVVGVDPSTPDEGETISLTPTEVAEWGDCSGTPWVNGEKFDAISIFTFCHDSSETDVHVETLA